jgi:putative sigma-54 modulation protein
MESSEALRQHAEERLTKIKRYFAEPIKVSATFEVAKIDHVAAFDVVLFNGLQLHASEVTENMYSSIDLALAKMERQVRRYKDRITDHKPSMGNAKRMRHFVLEEGASADAAAEQETPAAANFRIVKETEYQADRLTAEKAVMQMNLLHRNFLVFTNAQTGDINVVHRLEDGSYGLIETHGHVDESAEAKI